MRGSVPRFRRPRAHRGFSLLECIIATFVLAVGFVAVASMYPMAYRGATVNANHVAAMEIASGVMARIRSAPYGTAVASDVIADVSVTSMVENQAVVTTFSKQVSFVRGGSVASAGAASDVVKVTVTWTEGTGVGSAATKKSVTVTGGIFREP